MKILFNILTHGDETIGLAVAQEIKKLHFKKGAVTFHIANKKAFKHGKRYIDQDLNRSFPGKKNGNHEERLAHAIAPLVRSADVVIDIHSTTSTLKDAIIITHANQPTLDCIGTMQPKYVLLMQATKNNSLISDAKIGIAFEYGKDTSTRALRSMVSDLTRLFQHLHIVPGSMPKKRRETTFFTVTSAVPKPHNALLLPNIKNYVLVRKGQAYAKHENKLLRARKSFYPILFGQKNYESIFGFMAKKQKPLLPKEK